MSYIIGSFNVQNMNFTSGSESKKNFDRFADIIRQEKFDVIALQEILSPIALQQIVNRLNPQYWGSFIDSPTVTLSPQASKGYAYLWNKRRLHPVNTSYEATILDEYRIRRNSSNHFQHGGSLIRPPLVIRLTPQGLPGGSNFEIRLINTHIIHDKPSSCIDTAGKSEKEIRLDELKVLAEEIYRKVADNRTGNNLPAYTILLGDYNLCLCGGGTPTMDELAPIDRGRFLRTVQREKTTLKDSPKNTSALELNREDRGVAAAPHVIDYYVSNYDHFSYEVTLDDVMTLTASRVEALGKYYGNDLAAYRREISDHVPIKLVMQLSKRRQ